MPDTNCLHEFPQSAPPPPPLFRTPMQAKISMMQALQLAPADPTYLDINSKTRSSRKTTILYEKLRCLLLHILLLLIKIFAFCTLEVRKWGFFKNTSSRTIQPQLAKHQEIFNKIYLRKFSYALCRKFFSSNISFTNPSKFRIYLCMQETLLDDKPVFII